MATKKKKKEKPQSKKDNPITVVLLLIALGGLGFYIYQQIDAVTNLPPQNLVHDSVEETVREANKNGWLPCPGECLKLATPGWQHKEMKNYPPTDVWMIFDDSKGDGWHAFSQRHIGHLIKRDDEGVAQDTGACPICHGTGWVRKK